MKRYELIMWDWTGGLISEISLSARNDSEAGLKTIGEIEKQNKYSNVRFASVETLGTGYEPRAGTLNVYAACRHCPNATVFTGLDRDGWEEFTTVPKRERRNIQQIFPAMSAEGRELLISGTCDDCFDKLYGGDE